MAARLAARLESECNAHVETRPGGLGEFTVLVENEEVVSTNRLWYPNLARALQAVKSRLAR